MNTARSTFPAHARPSRRAAALLAACFVCTALAAGCARKTSTQSEMPVETVSRRDISVTVEASGTIEPVDLVEVKSKASGQITRMPVEIGSVVKRGDLLVQVDPRDVRNSYDQAEASQQAAMARDEIARRQRQRSDELLKEQIITAAEHEQAVLDDANARSQLVAARTNLDLARQRLEDATIQAPIHGTVLEKPVAVGQVISSATSSVSGGTTLLKMADLSRIRMRALVAESDIGRVRTGQSVRVEVDAFAGRAFPGTVEKIEPQAVVQQSVTMFPVLVSIGNEQGLLLPGMNGEVTMTVDERSGVLAVPIDGLRNAREISTIATRFGLNADSLRAMILRRPGSSGPGAGPDSARRAAGAEGAGAAGAGGAAGSDDAQRMARMRERVASGEITPEMMQRMRARMAGGGGGGPRSGAGGGRGFAGGGAAPGGTSRMQIAIVKTATGYEPRAVRVGISDYDYAEVLDGLAEGDRVAMLSYAEMQAQRDRVTDFARSRMGGGLTTTTTGGAGGGRGTSGGAPSGGGAPGGR